MATLPNWLNCAFHSGAAPYVSNLYPRFGDVVTLRLRLPASAPVRRVWLRTFPDGEQRFEQMQPHPDGKLVWHTVDRTIDEPTTHYRFLIEADDGTWWYTANGPQLQEPLDAFDFRILADYDAPSWLLSTVFYQIFPDRYACGDPSTNVQPHEYAYEGDRPKTYQWGHPPDADQPFPITFYGGDLPGIEQKLDHIEQLGINGVYLNPVFTAYSNHKYDVIDYNSIDPHFGGNDALISLRNALAKRTMRYMLDIVPNHCGYKHNWFLAAQADPSAPEADYFTFHNHPHAYESWLGVHSLPKLNYNSTPLRQRMYAAADSVMQQWLKPPFSADAWRVDVANMLGRQGATQIGADISRGIRAAVKSANPDSYLLGENFFDATPQLQGDQYDGVMNYMGFTNPLIYWLTGYHIRGWGMRNNITSAVPYSTAAMLTTMQERMAVVPWQLMLQQYNLLGSHDTPRIRTLVNGDDSLHKLAVLVLLTYPGIPCIYYGDEIGMVDDAALEQRGCMVWDEAAWNHDILAYYKSLIGLRRQSAALQHGAFQFVASGADYFAYTRSTANQTVFIIANRGEAQANVSIPLNCTSLVDGATLVDHFTNQPHRIANGQLTLTTMPKGGLLLTTS